MGHIFKKHLMKVVKRICLWALSPVALVAGLFFLLTGWFYITCPIYSFDEPKPFSGTSFYNPYQTINVDTWKKCVFHLHSKSWLGLTNGENSYEEMIEAYTQLNYDIIAVSDYMKISPQLIPVYEHGYNVKKTHQLAIGTQKIMWRDYFFPQNLHQKQHIIDMLKKRSRLVAVNHPTMSSGYRTDDFKYLSGYDLFEVQNGTHLSEKAWDMALSSGRPAWLIANDDAHSVRPERLQREVTFVNALIPDEESLASALDAVNTSLTPVFCEWPSVMSRLAQGVAFGVHFPRKKQATMDEKIEETKVVSFPVSIQVQGDTLHIVWGQTMQQIDFIGDNGRLLKTVTGSDAAFYPVRPQDSYVRVKLTSTEGLVYYLNPIIRCDDNQPLIQAVSNIDKVKTFWKRAVITLFFGVIFLMFSTFLLSRRDFLRTYTKTTK